MRIIRGIESIPPDLGPTVAALGTFDGVHLGHQAILGTAVERARSLGLTALACTFTPHPADVLRPGRAPLPITTLEERLVLMDGLGLGAVLVIRFTPALAAMEPEAFVADVVLGALAAREVVVGFNHRFGRAARGDAPLLQRLAAHLGFAAHIVPPLVIDGAAISSSEIRATLGRGDVERAAQLLGRPYTLAGTVVRGAGRGRALGFPTANLACSRPPLVPLGVYAARAEIGGATYRAAVNVGRAPTFGENAVTIEAHLVGFAGELYGHALRLEFLARLREERKFPSAEALREQIARDTAAAARVP